MFLNHTPPWLTTCWLGNNLRLRNQLNLLTLCHRWFLKFIKRCHLFQVIADFTSSSLPHTPTCLYWIIICISKV